MSSNEDSLKFLELLGVYRLTCSELKTLNEDSEREISNMEFVHHSLVNDYEEHVRECTAQRHQYERLIEVLRGDLDRRIREVEDHESSSSEGDADELAQAEKKCEEIKADLVCERSKNFELRKQLKILQSQIQQLSFKTEQTCKELSEEHRINTEILLAKVDEQDGFGRDCEVLRKRLAAAEATNDDLKRALAVSRQQYLSLQSATEEQNTASKFAEMVKENLDLKRMLELLKIEKSALYNRVEVLGSKLESSQGIVESLQEQLARSQKQNTESITFSSQMSNENQRLLSEVNRLVALEKKSRNRYLEVIQKFKRKLNEKAFEYRRHSCGRNLTNLTDSRPELINNS